VRALRTRLTIAGGVAAGVVLGAAALTRQSALVVAVALLAAVVLVARSRSLHYAGAAALAMVLVAGPWWYHQLRVYGNPVQSNLNRPGYMLDHQPRSFYVSLPTELVTRPHYYHFENKLLPRFHAYLWADWAGNYHGLWESPKPHAKTLASVQSVLGFGGDALVLGGLAFLGIPALVRAFRHRAMGVDTGLATLATLFLVSWAAYVATLVRFPQKGGDPIKVHYLLFLGPVSVVLAIAAGTTFARCGRWARVVLFAWLAAYTVSWALTLLTAF